MGNVSATPVLIVHTLGFAAFVDQTGGTSQLLPGSQTLEIFAMGLTWLLTGIGVLPVAS